jgi:hypothetical protein
VPLSLAKRTQIEDAIMVALKPLLVTTMGGSAAYGYARAIKPYNGGAAEDIKRELGGQLPGILVVTAGEKGVGRTMSRSRKIVELEIEIWCVSGNLRGHPEKARGSEIAGDTDPGTFKMMEDVETLIAGDDDAEGINVSGVGHLDFADVQQMVEQPDFLAWRVRFLARVDEARKPSSAPDLTTIAGTGHLPNADQTLAAGVGLALGVAAGVVTLTAAGPGIFTAGMVGARVIIAGAAQQANNGIFTITAYVSPTQVRFANAAAVAEPGFPGTWTVTPKPQLVGEADFS